jgi:ribonucleoside-triphosphate reductase
LYPNFVNLDAPYNKELYIEGRPETEMATMGCRTRVGLNKHDPDKSVIPGRGNLSFTSINLPRLAILAQGDIDKFFKLLDEKLELVHRQLLERFEIQCKKHPVNFPFLMGQGVWLGSEQLGPKDDIREILKHGTLAVGFIGLAETLTALTGKHHGESEESQKLGLSIVQHMRDYTDAWSEEEKMNYSVIGTPAEGLSGRFVRMDKKLFGSIPGVTDKDYYTNSSHIPVSYPISAFKKIEIEAPYHSLEQGGHILYIEMDGDPTKNLKAFIKVVRYMHDKNAGYFAINHPVDRDPVAACGYVGIINDTCPRCGRREGEPMTVEMWNKLKGYANVGNADTLGYHGDINEENDRLVNPLN